MAQQHLLKIPPILNFGKKPPPLAFKKNAIVNSRNHPSPDAKRNSSKPRALSPSCITLNFEEVSFARIHPCSLYIPSPLNHKVGILNTHWSFSRGRLSIIRSMSSRLRFAKNITSGRLRTTGEGLRLTGPPIGKFDGSWIDPEL